MPLACRQSIYISTARRPACKPYFSVFPGGTTQFSRGSRECLRGALNNYGELKLRFKLVTGEVSVNSGTAELFRGGIHNFRGTLNTSGEHLTFTGHVL